MASSTQVFLVGSDFVETSIAINLRVASSTVFIYNFFQTIGDEIDYIWRKNWTSCTVIYLVTRYLSVSCLIFVLSKVGFRRNIININDPQDTPFFDVTLPELPVNATTYLGAVVFFFAMALLQVRAYALCDKRRSLLYTFYILDALAFLAFIVEVTVVQRTFLGAFFSSSENLGDTKNARSMQMQGDLTPIFWIPFFLNETVTFAFVVHKARRSRILGIRHAGKLSLLNTLVQHNILYYFSIFIVYILGLGLLVGLIDGENLFSIAFDHLFFSIMMSGILAPNLFLSLRKSYYSLSEESDVSIPLTSVFHARTVASQLLSVH